MDPADRDKNRNIGFNVLSEKNAFAKADSALIK